MKAKKVLFSFTDLIVYGVDIDNKSSNILMDLITLEERWYELKQDVHITLITNHGKIFFYIKKGFKFDGRSGPKILDWYEPNLGDIHHRIAWFCHDILSYALFFDYATTNVTLQELLKFAGDSKAKASVVHFAVSLSHSWFGIPNKGEREYPNLNKIMIYFV